VIASAKELEVTRARQYYMKMAQTRVRPDDAPCFYPRNYLVRRAATSAGRPSAPRTGPRERCKSRSFFYFIARLPACFNELMLVENKSGIGS
jgi:hypothetical protein